jgi:Transposase, Mutator family
MTAASSIDPAASARPAGIRVAGSAALDAGRVRYALMSAEAAPTPVVATCCLRGARAAGVPARRMEKLVESLGITRLPRSQVSEMGRDLDKQVEAFRTRPLDAGP